ncbi:MAG: hypothetical protein J1E82_03905 [Muribaculaceae bacterium]|nr:hypothetical protein [Muribaculaceae bacterium]
MKNLQTIYLFAVSVLMGMAIMSCTTDREPLNPSELKDTDGITMLRALVDIDGWENKEPGTRLTIEKEDGWSFARSAFGPGDTVGVMARTGNMNLMSTDGKGGPLINIPMYFTNQEYPVNPNDPNSKTETKQTLENDTVMIRPASMNNLGVMMYYPYDPGMGSLANYPNWKEYPTNIANANMVWDKDGCPPLPGMEVRTVGPDGEPRCRDILFMITASADYISKGILSGTFYHLFNEIVVVRGEGFKNPVQKITHDDGSVEYVKNEDIYVILNTPISHIRPVSRTDHVYWTFQLYYKDGYEFNGKPMDREEASRWKAWKGSNWPYDEKDPTSGDEAWYVMFPNIYYTTSSSAAAFSHQNASRPTVTEIQIYDDNGYLQHVSSFDLKADDTTAASTKTPYPFRRYAIQIDMTELGPTVRPVSIENWDSEGKDKDLTEIRKAGINDEQDYNDWAAAYNTYILNGRSPQYAEPLKRFGDMIDGGERWNFYIAPFTFTQEVPVVTDLQDQLIGNNNFFNIEFKNLQLTHPLFTKISRNGGITNIDFVSPYLMLNTSDPVGIITGEISSAVGAVPGVVFENCNISNATVINEGVGAVGVMAGKCSYGKINNCEFSGFLMGTKNTSGEFKGLFGEEPTNAPDVNASNYNNII